MPDATVATQGEGSLRAWDFKRLKWSLQGLAVAASEQLALFPDAVVKADELALDFDHSLSVVRASYGEELSEYQLQVLGGIAEKLETMSRDGIDFDAELWTDAALHSSPQWEEVRKLATLALEAFGWSVESPPQDPGSRGSMYVR